MKKHFSIFVFLVIAGNAWGQSYTGNLHIGQGPSDLPISSFSGMTFTGLDPNGHDSIAVKWIFFDTALKQYVPKVQKFEMQQINDISASPLSDSAGFTLTIHSNNTQYNVFLFGPSDSIRASMDSVIFPPVAPFSGVEPFPSYSNDLVRCYPNPTSAGVTIALNLPERERIHLALANASGKTIRDFGWDEYPAGLQHIPWNGLGINNSRLPNGDYFLTVDGNGKVSTVKLTIIH